MTVQEAIQKIESDIPILEKNNLTDAQAIYMLLDELKRLQRIYREAHTIYPLCKGMLKGEQIEVLRLHIQYLSEVSSEEREALYIILSDLTQELREKMNKLNYVINEKVRNLDNAMTELNEVSSMINGIRELVYKQKLENRKRASARNTNSTL